jgi:hypothetical protein
MIENIHKALKEIEREGADWIPLLPNRQPVEGLCECEIGNIAVTIFPEPLG